MSKRIKELSERILQANHDYYNQQPTMSDAAFDALKDELTKLDPDNKALKAIGAPVVSEWKKAQHKIAMGSLNKVNTDIEFKAWCKSSNSIDFLTVDKLDGISISTEWENGKLVQAITRGNGSEGEDITVNVQKMKGIPPKLVKPFSGHLRGEIVLTKTDHQQYFAEYANARNAAGGIAKRLDGVGVEHLTVMMYKVEGKDFDTERGQFLFLEQLGVLVPNYTYCKSVDDALKIYADYSNGRRESLNFDIDGLVFSVDNIAKQLSLGEKNHRPAGQVAFKFANETRETVLRNIVWQVGNSGRISPVAEFDMVEIVGAKITRSSLFNYSYIKELGLDIGCSIIVSRANDVIPYVEEVSKPTDSVAKYPNTCPKCNSNTYFNGEYLVCPNKLTCPAQKLGRLMAWVNENNILDFSEATLQRFIDAGLVNDVADLYKLKQEQIEVLDRMGTKLAKKLVEILDQHRSISIQNIIGGLNIDGIATSTAKLVVDAGYDTLDKILAMSLSQYEAIAGFGEIRAKAFHNGLKTNKQRIKDILEAGVTIKAKPQGVLSKKSFCFTGSSSMPRAQLQKLVEDNGGDVKKSVGKGLSFLVTAEADSTSNKAKAAAKFGTQVITEAEFMKMVGVALII